MQQIQYLHIENERIPYRFVRTRNKSLALKFPKDKPYLSVEIPKECPQSFAEDFIRKKQDWIVKQYRQLQQLENRKAIFWEDIENGKIQYMGEPHEIRMVEGNRNHVQIRDQTIWVHLNKGHGQLPAKTVLFPALKALASNYLKNRTHQLADYTQLPIKQVRVKNHSSKWGSCSSLRNINLNWHLIFLPATLIDYVIIHELMHLREMNHSKAFWDWVGRYYPNYKQARRALKTYQWLIGIFEEE